MDSYTRATRPDQLTINERGDDFMDRRARSAKILSFTMDLMLNGVTRAAAVASLRTNFRSDHIADAVPSNANICLSPAEALVEHVYPKLEKRKNMMGEMMKRVREEVTGFTPYGDVLEFD